MAWTGSRAEWDEFLGMLTPSVGKKILDVGAGKGTVAAKVLQSSHAEVYAVDPDEKRVSQMVRDFPDLRGSVAGAEKLPFQDSNFDRVYTTMALHHFTDIDGGVAEIARVLKKGGTFVILEVEPGSWMGRLFRSFERLMGEHLTFLKEEELLAKLNDNRGFEVSKSAKLGSRYLLQLRRV